VVRLSEVASSPSRWWINILVLILIPPLITLSFILGSTFPAASPAVSIFLIFVAAILAPLTIMAIITSRAKRIPIAQPISQPEAIISPSPSRKERPILGFGMGTEAIEIYNGKELVARWDWSTITDVSLDIECMGPIWHFAAVTVYRGNESDTLMVVGPLGIPSNTRTIILADAIRRFSKDG